MIESASKGKLLLLYFALGLGTFIQILDTSIANVAIPYIAGNLSVSADEGTWVITSFAASNAIVLPLTGWLSDYFGRVRLFVWSVLLFSLASLICGFSTSLTMLVLFRVIQGAVAGSLIPLSQSLLIANAAPEKQGSVLGFWSMIVVVAPVLGPILGGYLTEVYSWPWIFFINVPIGIFSASVVWFILKDHETKIVRNPIDWVGLFFLSLSVASLQIMLDKGKDLDWFDSSVIVALAITSIVSLLYFIIWNRKASYPIVDFTFFKNRNFLWGTLTITIGYLIFFGTTVVVPLWLQTEQGYTAYWAGLAVAPIGVFPVIFSVFVGKYLKYFDIRAVAAASFFLFGITYFYQSNFTTEVSLEQVMLTRLLQGLGVTLFFIPLVQLSLGSIPNERYASASGLFNFIRILVGSGFGTSLSVYLWYRLETKHHFNLADHVNYYDPEISQLYQFLGAQNPHLIPTNISFALDGVVEKQAYMLATNDISWLGGWIFLLMIPIPFFCKRIQYVKSNGGKKVIAVE